MRLKSIAVHPVHIPYSRSVHWPAGTETGIDYAVIQLLTEDGLMGIAEATVRPKWTSVTVRTLRTSIEELFLPALKQIDLEDLTAVSAVLGRLREHGHVKAMLDVACWDLVAQKSGVPLWKLLGGNPEMEVSWTVTRDEPHRMAKEAEDMVNSFGFRVLKVKGGQGPETDFKALQEIRRAVGGEAQIYVDTNGEYAYDGILSYLGSLRELGVFLAEDPVRFLPDSRFEELLRQTPLPILVDNGCRSLAEARLFLDRGARALSIKVGKTGISESLQIAKEAEELGAQVHVGLFTESSLGSLVGLQLASAIGRNRTSLPAELTFFVLLSQEYVREPLVIKNGVVRFPQTEGLDSYIDWRKLMKLRA